MGGLNVIPKLSSLIIGASIVKVVALSLEDYDIGKEGSSDTLKDAYAPNSKIIIELSNGIYLEAWNSEWGGISVLDPNNFGDKAIIDTCEKVQNG